ncbi:MAG: hypothetical protein V4574_12340 [Pseudomonadota bacterium]
MPYLLQLHIFSGRPDPVWQISDKQAGPLFEQRRVTAGQLFEAQMAAAPRAAPGLGYRGFSLIESPREHARSALLEGALTPQDRGREAFIQGDRAGELLLLESGRGLLSPEVFDVAARTIQAPAATAAAAKAAACPLCRGATAPAYNPGIWNKVPVQANNNCYNYANNQATSTFAQPGRATGKMYKTFQCAGTGVQPAAVSDGLKAVPNFAVTIPGWYVALVIWPGQDFHWYRQDKNGCWSHKPGSTPARNTDNSGNTISDPKTCNRGPYTTFCSYMTTTTGAKIK